MSKIQRGGSLYSYLEEMFLGQMPVEDAVAHAVPLGARGIEILPEQNMPASPTIDRWIQDVMEVDSREQVRRRHVPFDRLIGQAEAPLGAEKEPA